MSDSFLQQLERQNNLFDIAMKDYKRLYINNSLNFANNSSPKMEPSFVKKINQIEENNSGLFKLSNQIDSISDNLNSELEKKNSEIKHLEKINKKYSSLLSSVNDSDLAALKMNKDTKYNYTLTTIEIYNYLVGIIFGVYILHNL